jgi:hypothetical protein
MDLSTMHVGEHGSGSSMRSVRGASTYNAEGDHTSIGMGLPSLRSRWQSAGLLELQAVWIYQDT